MKFDIMNRLGTAVRHTVELDASIPPYRRPLAAFGLLKETTKDFDNCNLSELIFRECTFIGYNFSNNKVIDRNFSLGLFTNCNFSGCDFTHSSLYAATFRNCNFNNSDFTVCDLFKTIFHNCDFSNSSFTSCSLLSTLFDNCNLQDANLTPIRDDVWAVLDTSPHEVPVLRTALLEGRVDGNDYPRVAPGRVTPGDHRPAERFFNGIKPGDSPDTNPVLAIALGWVNEWIVAHPTPELI